MGLNRPRYWNPGPLRMSRSWDGATTGWRRWQGAQVGCPGAGVWEGDSLRQAAGFGIAPAPPEEQAASGRESRPRPAGGQGQVCDGLVPGRRGRWAPWRWLGSCPMWPRDQQIQPQARALRAGVASSMAGTEEGATFHRGTAFPGPGLPPVCLSQSGKVAPILWEDEQWGQPHPGPSSCPWRPRAGPGHRAGPSARTRNILALPGLA